MTVQFTPKIGMLLMCDFSGFNPPEMVKTRPVVIISRRNIQVATVVPISGTQPHPLFPWHHELNKKSLPQRFWGNRYWAKCDMVTTLSVARFDRIRIGKDRKTGKRKYATLTVLPEDLNAIRQGVLAALDLRDLISHEG